MPEESKIYENCIKATKTKFKESITVKNNWIQVRDIVKSNFDQ